MYPDPPPPLVLELVEELPGECWDDIPPGPGPGGDETLDVILLPWATPLFDVPPIMLEGPPDPLTVNCILVSLVLFSLLCNCIEAPFTSEPLFELTGSSLSLTVTNLVVSSLV